MPSGAPQAHRRGRRNRLSYAARAIQIRRRRRPLNATTKWSTQTSFAATSLAAHQSHTRQLAGWIRGHWDTEAVHHIRDVTYREDASHIRAGNGPQVMATCVTLASPSSSPVDIPG